MVEQPDFHSSSQPQTRQFPRDDLMLQEKLGEGEYGPIYRYIRERESIEKDLIAIARVWNPPL